MVYHDRGVDKSGSSELPRNAETNWILLGRVVYSWTDRRDSEADQHWWVQQRPRIYSSAVRERPAAEHSAA